MKENLLITFFLCIFAKWIGGSHEPSTRVIQQPFHFAYLLESLNVGVYMQKLTREEVVKRLYNKWGDKYDYSKVVYVNRRTKVCVTCKEHGDFYILPTYNLKFGCPICAEKERVNHIRLTKDEFVERAKKVHGNKYDYSNTVYNHSMEKVAIICREHGTFYQTPNVHLSGGGCPICGLKSTKFKKKFVENAQKVHGNKYDYSKVVVKSSLEKVTITCPIHGDFQQQAFSHLNGCGCPECSTTLSKGENKISYFLSNYKIDYLSQFKIKNENIFCNRKTIIVDFYLKSKNIIIEYNGQQHYKKVEYFGGENIFYQQRERDMALRQYCKEHKIKLIEIPYWDFDNIETILKKELEIK